jgi:flagellar basal-body rod modification protein FlgD
MTTISQIQTSPQATQTQNDSVKASLDYDSFLKLLLQQLKSQDPTAPVDQKETLAQLASFSNVEQTIKLNQKLDTMLNQQRVLDASSVIGKHVESLVNTTAGKVMSVEVLQGKVFAILETGAKLELSNDVRISE